MGAEELLISNHYNLVNRFAGTKQKELGVGSMALLEQYSPLAAMMLAIMVPIFEPLGLQNPTPKTLIGCVHSLAC